MRVIGYNLAGRCRCFKGKEKGIGTRGYRDRCITGLDYYSRNKTRIHSRPRDPGIIKSKSRGRPSAIKLASRVHAREFSSRGSMSTEAIGTVSLSQLDARNDDLMISVNCVS